MTIAVPASPLMRGMRFLKRARQKLVRMLFPEVRQMESRIRLLEKRVQGAERKQNRDRQYWYYRCLPPDRYERELCAWYRGVTGKTLNLREPETFNEKIQWLKLYDSTPVKSRLADKYLVRDWIREKGEEQILVPLIGVYDHFDEIDFDALPRQFVIKTTHGCGWNVIVKDKAQLDWQETGRQVEEWLTLDYAFRNGFELQYANIRPRIIIEKYIGGLAGSQVVHRFYCFNGVPRFVTVGSFERPSCTVFDMQWRLRPFSTDHGAAEIPPEQPATWSELKRLAEKLCRGFSFVRVDLDPGDGEPLFSEMTFTPGSGITKWSGDQTDRLLGAMLTLPAPYRFRLVSQDIVEHAEPEGEGRARRRHLPAAYRRGGNRRYTGRRHVWSAARYGKRSR